VRLDGAIRRRFLGYLSRILRDVALLPVTTGARPRFRERYLTDFWTLVARKGPA
jgi:hypothetical protein